MYNKKYYLEHKEECNTRNNKYRLEHKENAKIYQRKYYQQHKDYFKEYGKKYQKEHKEQINKYTQKHKLEKRKYSYKFLYNLLYNDWLKMWESQEGKCAICGKPFTKFSDAFIDHNHVNNKIRGLLCIKCNTGIGCFNDDIENIKKAIKYLEEKEMKK